MGKQEGFENTTKRKCHDVYIKDKLDTQWLECSNQSNFCEAGSLFWFSIDNEERHFEEHDEQ